VKKKLNIIIIAVLFILSCTFTVLYAVERNDHSELETLCLSGARSALDGFERYIESDADGDYLYAVADFNTYKNAYYQLTESTDYTVLNEVYGYMVLYPERVKDNIDTITEALKYLSEDYDHMNGIHLMYNARNSIKHGD